MEIEIKYRNKKRGEDSIKEQFDNTHQLYNWLDHQDRISGQFVVKINGGYSKNPKDGSTMVSNFKNAQVIQIKSILSTVINRYKEVKER